MPARLTWADGRVELVERCLIVVDEDEAGNERARFAVQPKPAPTKGKPRWKWVLTTQLRDARLVPDVAATPR